MLIIVESPTKAKKIAALLKTRTISTVGHFKDLPETVLGVDLASYEPTFVYLPKKEKLPGELRQAARGEQVFLAGDPDREGYAISTHIFEEVREVAASCLRLEIFEVTERGLRDSLAKAVPFETTNHGLYDAYLGRRIGDRLVGYLLSPLASRALGGSYSVGRVQSPAVRLVVDREREIRRFVATPYWVLAIELEKDGTRFTARHLRGKFEDQSEAAALAALVAKESHALAEKVELKEVRQFPKPPFTTVDLQAAAAARLKMTPEQTMRLAQGLFDHGLITYHRTDSVRMSDEFIEELRRFLTAALGAAYLPEKPHRYSSKNTQADAHEGIRPTHLHHGNEIGSLIGGEGLGPEHARLYELIFRRAVASQMAAARYDATALLFDVVGEKFRANGRVLTFDGFLKVYQEAEEEKERKGEEEPVQLLPPVAVGERVRKERELLDEKKTKPPGRFTFGTLVKELERLEIGRPSTYAAITRNISERGYVREEKGKVVPLPPGESLVDYLREKHPWVIDYELTRRMEGFLDLVVEKKETWQRFCKGVHGKMEYAAPVPRGAAGAPTQRQLAFAAKLAQQRGEAIPETVLKSGKELSAWIKQAVGEKPPSRRKAAGTGAAEGKGGEGAAGRKGTEGAAGGARRKAVRKAGAAGAARPGGGPARTTPAASTATEGGTGIGSCPACGSTVVESDKGFGCAARCGFMLWKDRLSRWKKEITAPLAADLLRGGPVSLKDLVSAKHDGKKFHARGILEQDPKYGWTIRLIFKDDPHSGNSAS
ncbi:type IA DNA topoisomerase [Geomesophilobacter sediminis]|uniref:DNA topoisomerase n=1 Tax=Geomesophilobacter sediminis TaxID=2798584 RepID=A0A8J7JA69_9BACT|nr:type IA DNA topoisomerase [Geomesophilobacter sediminis]MBJ6723711.1 type I DNA topoisomerase [Geomesophilobacter sediminis]